MLVEMLFYPFTLLVNFIIMLVPAGTPQASIDTSSILVLASKGVGVIGPVSFSVIIANILAWQVINMTWVIIEWSYKKIPGVS